MSTSVIKHLLLSLLLSLSYNFIWAQNDKKENEIIYKAANEKINKLIHTKLDVSFNYPKRQLNGKAWITLKPYFYSTDSLTLHAKGMDIKQVALITENTKKTLQYSYDSLFLKIQLDKKYEATDQYEVFIDYVAKPDELKANGSRAITSAKGLYFINPDSTISGKPVQIWTQGETEASSVWFPTIDSPNQKTTQEIYITVPRKYKTLSNGLLLNQTENKDGTRTDYWKMNHPHAPYLFMMAVGDFKITKDQWKNIPLEYYLEPKYAPYTQAIFGDTPKMMEFFSQKLGIDYPWEKYAQIVVRDYVSGAMENTTATLHGDFVQQTDREIIDEHAGEEVIAHELFHHWFGNYVTAESWGNLAINESFANFSEMLWIEHKHGKDEGDAKNYEDMQSYLNDLSAVNKSLIRFYYKDKEDMFDVVSYQKGGRILNMLRNIIGEDAFFKSLHIFLKQYAFKTGEAHQFRLAVEEATGKDMNWFFNQWFFGAGHPTLEIRYKWNEIAKKQYVYLKQTQENNTFTLPFKIDIYRGKDKETLTYTLQKKADTLTFSLNAKPDLINIDADKVLLVEKDDEKSMEQYLFQQKNAPLYLDRLEALDAAITKPHEKYASEIILNALNDPSYRIRMKAIDALNFQKKAHSTAIPLLRKIVENDPKTIVQATAIDALAKKRDKNDLHLFMKALHSNSYSVQAAALAAITSSDFNVALDKAKELKNQAEGSLSNAIVSILASNGDINDFDFIVQAFREASPQSKIQMSQDLILMLGKINDTHLVKSNIDELYNWGLQYKNYGLDKYAVGLLDTLISFKQDLLKTSIPQTDKKAIQEQIDYTEKTIDKLLK